MAAQGAVVFDAMLELDAGPHGLALPNTGDIAADLRAQLCGSITALH
ncbi:hypothetical protein [Nocardia ninae]|nr:hypothetical protein [Nocardia ninae]